MALINSILAVLIILVIFLAGVLIGARINLENTQGLWTSNTFGFSGDWVHINVDNMSFKRAMEVCQHEVGHEIFAEFCEDSDNFNKCAELVDFGYGYGKT